MALEKTTGSAHRLAWGILLLQAACSGTSVPDGSGGAPPASGGAEGAGAAPSAGGTAGGGGTPTSGGGGASTGGASSGGTVSGGGGGASGGVPSGGGSVATGGAPADGGAPATGGAPVGGSAGTGGMATGGTSSVAFQCPPGSEALTPTLSGKTASEPIAGVPEIVNNGGFLEGPVWFEGKLYMTQLDFVSPINNADILVYTPGTGFEKFILASGTNGLALGPGDRLVGASQVAAGIISFDLRDPTAAPMDVARMYMGSTFNSPNDVTVQSDGTVYFSDPNGNCGNCTNQPVQGVYRVPPGGSPELVSGITGRPNGVTLSLDESVLYVSGDNLVAIPIGSDGTLGTPAPFGNSISGADGMVVDCAGNLYLAHYAQSMIIALDPQGNQLPGSIAVTEPTNLAFGGPESKTLYVTSFGDNRGQLQTIEMEVPGLPF